MKITASLIDIIGTRRQDRASTGRTGREEERYGRREKRRSKRIVIVAVGGVRDRSLKSLETSFNHILAILADVIKLG